MAHVVDRSIATVSVGIRTVVTMYASSTLHHRLGERRGGSAAAISVYLRAQPAPFATVPRDKKDTALRTERLLCTAAVSAVGAHWASILLGVPSTDARAMARRFHANGPRGGITPWGSRLLAAPRWSRVALSSTAPLVFAVAC